jgi:hypothetical protein
MAVVVNEEKSQARILDHPLIVRAKSIAIDNEPRCADPVGQRDRLNGVIMASRLNAQGKNLCLIKRQAEVRCRRDTRESRTSSLVLPGLRQRETPQDVTGAYFRAGVGSEQHSEAIQIFLIRIAA